MEIKAFEYFDYRSYFSDLINSSKTSLSRLSRSQLAESIGVQTPYVSKVLSGKADFSEDQLFLACDYFDVNEEETKYLELLLSYHRCSLEKRKRQLKFTIESLRQKHLKTDKYIESAPLAPSDSFQEYYLDPYIQLIHIFLTIPKYANDPKSIAEPIGITCIELQQKLKILERLGLIRRHKNGLTFSVIKYSMHLPKDSRLNIVYQNLVRQRSLHQLYRTSNENKYNFSVTFASSKSCVQEIQLKFLKYIQEVERLAKKSNSQEVYQLNFDLFPWS